MNDRLRQLRKYLGLTQSEFAEKIGLSQVRVSALETGAALNDKTVKLICSIFHVREKWLRNGDGDMFAEGSGLDDEFLAIYPRLSPETQRTLLRIARDLEALQNELQNK